MLGQQQQPFAVDFPCGYADRRRWDLSVKFAQRTIYRFVVLGLKLYRWLFLDWRVWGRENIPQGPKIYCANHITSHEILLITEFPEPVHVIVGPACKSRIVARLCAYLQQINAMPSHRETVVPEAVAYLRRGESVFLNPEGDFSEPFELGPFYPGVARIYRQTRAAIVPIAVLAPKSSRRTLPMTINVDGHIYRTVVIRRGPYCIHFGEPFYPDCPDAPGDEQDAAILAQIRGRIEALVEETRVNTFWLDEGRGR